ncbi:hypothetical protein AAFM46_02720 [Arthrobacter sp. TMP15]|uniref:hypothetical protein n=1 Tax=Arthrobacter sp. TMP15 TaxID=3140789 RepID=UPI0031BA20EF
MVQNRRNAAWSIAEERDTDRILPNIQGCGAVVFAPDAVVATTETIVGKKDDLGVLACAQFLQVGDQLLCTLVYSRQRSTKSSEGLLGTAHGGGKLAVVPLVPLGPIMGIFVDNAGEVVPLMQCS